MDIAQLTADYERDGYLRIRGFLSPARLAEVRGRLEKYQREIVPGLSEGDRTYEADGKTVRNLWRLENHDPFFADLAQQADILKLVASLVHGTPESKGVETFNKPAKVGSGVPPHQDNAYFCQSPGDMLTVWIAMDPATVENGPIYYLKGSHKLGMMPHRASGVKGNSFGLAAMPPHEKSDEFCGTLEPGDALIHHCQTVHWSAANKTDRPRCGMLLVYRGTHTKDVPEMKEAYAAALAKVA
jgi:ectoine hydroxylase-related dioxygenase (phytanoyl-CoA dioxygenase family)